MVELARGLLKTNEEEIPSWFGGGQMPPSQYRMGLDTPASEIGGGVSSQFSFLGGPRQLDMQNLSFMDKMLGGTDTTTGKGYGGWGGKALGVAKGAADTWLTLKQLNLAEEKFDFQKEAFSKQFGVQRDLTNQELEARASRMYHSNPALNPTPEEYMAKHRIG